MREMKRNLFLFCSHLLVWLVLGTPVSAQDAKGHLDIRIDQIVSKDFPNITAYAVVQDEKGDVRTGLAPGLFQFRIDSMEVNAKTTVAPFALKEPPIDYSIIISNNGIMEGEPLDFQKNAILQFIDGMKPTDHLSLYAIGEEAIPLFEEQKQDAIDPATINSIEPTAFQPRLYDSLINVVRKVQRRTVERRIIIVISDGRDQNSRFTKDQLVSVLSESKLPIYSIGIRVLNAQSLSGLNEIADLTGGTYLYANNIANIPPHLKSLVAKITQPYVITMKVRKMKADDLPHTFEVSINERDSEGRGQSTFVAIKIPVPRWVRWVLLAAVVVFIAVLVVCGIFRRIQTRKRMGITKRHCPECNALMKDIWDTCPFCKYLPDKKKKGKKPPKEKKKKKNA